MNNSQTTLQEILNALEAESTLDNNHITSLLNKLDDKAVNLSDTDKMKIRAERMAFRFHPDSDFGKTNWGTYYGPFKIIRVDEKRNEIYPSIELVNHQVMEYWALRAENTTHPVMRARYADLIWDFSNKVLGARPVVTMAQMAIDAGVDAVSGNRSKHATTWILLRRSLELSISIGDQERLKKVIAVIIEHDASESKPGKRNAWGHSFDLLFSNTAKRVQITEEQCYRIVSGLEASLSASVAPKVNGEFNDPFAAKDAAQRLVSFYRKQRRYVDVKRIVSLFGQGVIDAANGVDEIMANAWLKDAFDFAVAAQDKDTSDRLAVALRSKTFDIKDKGHIIECETKVEPELLERFLLDLVEGDEEEALARIVYHYIPEWEQTKEQVLEISQKCVLTSMIRRTIVDSSGLEIASIGSVEDDLDGRTIHHMSNNMNYVADLVYLSIQKWLLKFEVTADKLCERLLASPVFTPQSKNALARGIHAYFEKDHITAIHLLIPQMESAFREFLIGGGGSIYRPNKLGGIDYRTLGDMINDALVKEVFGEDAQRYFKVLLVDPRGWNIRNTVCHALVDASVYVQPHSDRVLHVLLLFSLLKRRSKAENEFKTL
ncbi:MAG: DUF4209 domain-containing protein [bacterium]